MNTLKILKQIKEIYSNGQNIMEYLRNLEPGDQNSVENIAISYDFQAGSYIKIGDQNPELRQRYCSAISKTIEKLGDFSSILEVGIGEATTMGHVLNQMTKKPKFCYGFDISWSRIKYAQKFLKSMGIQNVFAFIGDLFETPIQDNSIDIVYTAHSIEPNGGREREALQELYRITNKYLVLLEPAFDLASEEAKKRMVKHGYITKLFSTAKDLGFKILEYRLFDVITDQMNPTGLLIIEKNKNAQNNEANPLACPITKAAIKKIKDTYFCEKSLLAYPIIDGIPCLLPQNAIIATHFLDE